MAIKSNNVEFSRTVRYEGKELTSYFNRKGEVKRVELREVQSEAKPAQSIAAIIDHSLLKPESTEEQVRKTCEDALKYGFFSVCVNPFWVRYCADLLKGSDVIVGCTIGFPQGANKTSTKVAETKQAIRDGAREVDMVMNIGALKSGYLADVQRDIQEVVRAAHKHGVPVKVILETCLLSDDEKVTACLLAKQAGADFVKTSTGFNSGGATVEDVALMRRVVGEKMGVKASGGMHSYEQARKMVEAGATRIGTSSGVRIADEEAGQAVEKAEPGAY